MKPNEIDENDVWVQNNKNDMKIKARHSSKQNW